MTSQRTKLILATCLSFLAVVACRAEAQEKAKACNQAIREIETDYDGYIAKTRRELGMQIREFASALEETHKGVDPVLVSKYRTTKNIDDWHNLRIVVEKILEPRMRAIEEAAPIWVVGYKLVENSTNIKICALRNKEGQMKEYGCSQMDLVDGRVRGRTVPAAVRLVGRNAAEPWLGFTAQSYVTRRMRAENPVCIADNPGTMPNSRSRAPASE